MSPKEETLRIVLTPIYNH